MHLATINIHAIANSVSAFNYLVALYQDTKVILEVRRDRLVVICCGKHMALGLEVGTLSAPDHRIATITTHDWLRLFKLIQCFEIKSNSTELGIATSDSALVFSSKSQGWTLTIPASLGGDLLKLPTTNLKATVDMGAMTSILGIVVHKLGDDAEKRHRLEFGYSIQGNPIVKVLNRDGDEIGAATAQSIHPPTASGISINPAHLHDGIVLLKKENPMKTIARLSDSRDSNYWVIQCVDRQDFLLVSRFR